MSGKRKAARKPVKDFATKKQKVGKTARAPENATQTLFKTRSINIPLQKLHDPTLTQSIHQASNQTDSQWLTQLKVIREEISIQSIKLPHYNATVRRDACSRIRELIDQSINLSTNGQSVLDFDLALLIERIVPLIVDPEKIVRTACLSCLTVILSTCEQSSNQSQSVNQSNKPSINQSLMSPFMRLILSFLCSSMSHIDPSIRRSGLDFLSLLIDRLGPLMKSHSKQICPNLLSMIEERNNQTVNQTLSKQLATEKNKSEKSTGQAINQSNAKFRMHLLDVIDKFLTLCCKTESINQTNYSSISRSNKQTVIVSEIPAMFDDHRAALHMLVTSHSNIQSTEPAAETDPITQSNNQSITQLANSNAVPLKYQRRGGMQSNKRSTIQSMNEDHFINQLQSNDMFGLNKSNQSNKQAVNQPINPLSTTTMSLNRFCHRLIGSLIECFIESIAGDGSDSNDSYQSINSIVSSLKQSVIILKHIQTTNQANNQTSNNQSDDETVNVLDQFRPDLAKHVFSHFPLLSLDQSNESNNQSINQTDLVSSINAQLCHLINEFLTPIDQSTNQSDEQQDTDPEEADWIAAMLEYIGESFRHRASQKGSTSQTTQSDEQSQHLNKSPFNQSSKHPNNQSNKRKKRSGSQHSVHVSQLLPVLSGLIDRLVDPLKIRLIDDFTVYFDCLHSLSPSKVLCLDLIDRLLVQSLDRLYEHYLMKQSKNQSITQSVPFNWLIQPSGIHWIASLPSILLESTNRSVNTSNKVIQTLLTLAHRSQSIDQSIIQTIYRTINPAIVIQQPVTLIDCLFERLKPVWIDCLGQFEQEMQNSLIALLHYCSFQSTSQSISQSVSQLTTHFAQSINASLYSPTTDCLILDLIEQHRQKSQPGKYINFLLSCTKHNSSSLSHSIIQSGTESDMTDVQVSNPFKQSLQSHPQTKPVIERLITLIADDETLQSSRSMNQSTNAEICTLIILPVLETALFHVSNSVSNSQSDQPTFSFGTMLDLSIALSQETYRFHVAQSTSAKNQTIRSNLSIKSLPPRLCGPLIDCLIECWTHYRRSYPTDSFIYDLPQSMSLLVEAPYLLIQLFDQFINQIILTSKQSSDPSTNHASNDVIYTAIDCLIVCLNSQSLRKYLVNQSIASRVEQLTQTIVTQSVNHQTTQFIHLQNSYQLVYGQFPVQI